MKFKFIFLLTLISVLFALDASQANAASSKLAIAVPSASFDKVEAKKEEDKRVKVLKEFLSTHNSPLEPYAPVFIEEADKNGLDWKLVASISGVESTFGKHLPYNSYNAWGWGIYGNNVLHFTSYDEAIKTISKSLKQDYMDKWGAQDVYQIGKIYAADPNWSTKVTYFMNRIEKFAYNDPKDTLSLTL